ncbi:hypothetical protein HELRODRAFT_155886 [Helobdella robusta]|uniref:Ubiquitin carboxyl-terminal hydrolase n=1 Tax=Helobdella robusta TaxID=6412 RepID=T1ELN7_HELRO|nr:hypothetical protein HELRODRAFT_155886 [Helobdella robusta]ESN98734.1 hypothetical protein HELRODRAFT_155886 [Helobdella robusta]
METCSHLDLLKNFSLDELNQFKNPHCSSCLAPNPNLWLCLQPMCNYIGCGESVKDHSLQHSQLSKHPLIINLSTKRLWCNVCEMEVHLKMFSQYSQHSYQELNMFFCDDSDDSYIEDKMAQPRGLVGLINLGNTCYMNAAIQSLSNCPPLTQFFLDCPGYVNLAKRPNISKIFMRLMAEIWHKNRPRQLSPTGLFSCIKQLHPMFRGFSQHDSQEFLRYLMDNLHEELKEIIITPVEYDSQSENSSTSKYSVSKSLTSDLGYDTCESVLANDQASVAVSCNSSSSGFTQKEFTSRDNVDEESHDSDNTQINSDENFEHVDENVFAGEMENYSKDIPPRTRSQTSLRADMFDNIRESNEMNKLHQTPEYSSIISDIFDGHILSSVQCMTCENISTTKEVFQDLSLPIPSSDQIPVIRSSNGIVLSSHGSSDDLLAKRPGWMSWFYNLFRGMIWGPSIHLQDCLAAFFSADDLKGDNMYSCEKCKKLRNGLKYSKVMKLPEILCIHLKRFRHDYTFSSSSASKISSAVVFPVERLDMQPYLHKDCKDSVTSYCLIAVICHHGTANGGHYTAYGLNTINNTWYEYDDQTVTEVDIQQVERSQAYVLFYQKLDDEINILREKVQSVMKINNNGLMKFYISRKWLSKFKTFSEPGPINNYDFLCRHGAVKPQYSSDIMDLVIELPPRMWEFFHSTFGGGPSVNHLLTCDTCKVEIESLKKRREYELNMFLQLNRAFKENEPGNSAVVAISMTWFREWENFVRGISDIPPKKIENSHICTMRSNSSSPVLLQNSDYGQMGEDTYNFLSDLYGGGPLVYVQQRIYQMRLSSSNSDNY